MRNDIRLFIHGKEVEFSQDPKILLNYKEKELTNPTVVRNTFSKQITVEGTNTNNDVFGHIWDLTRIQDGSVFNPIQKTDFELYVNDELFQRGYVKLDKVTRRNHGTQYVFTLYGGLGSFFYSLAYEPESDTRKTLASLRYTTTDGEPAPDLDFTITKDAVHDAWTQINRERTGGEPIWDVLNFVPAYEGYPDFAADTALVNLSGTDAYSHAVTVDGQRYAGWLNGAQNDNGYALATLPEDATSWETFDLRSYLQRPALSMYRLIQACCDPRNNGGFKVDLDRHFFHQNNPYYYDAWMTLPRIAETQEGGTVTEDVSGVTLTKDGRNGYAINYTLESLSALTNVRMRLGVTFTPTGSTTATDLFTSTRYDATDINAGLRTGTWVKRFTYNSGVILRVEALDTAGNVVGTSKTYLLSGDKYYPGTRRPLWDYFPHEKTAAEIYYGPELAMYGDIEYLQGYWTKSGSSWTFADMAGNPVDLDFSFPTDAMIGGLKMTVRTNYGYDTRYAVYGSATYQLKDGDSDQLVNLYTATTTSVRGKHTVQEAMSAGAVPGRYGLVVRSFEAMASSYEGLRSGSVVRASKLLGGEKSPADYLLDYCKMFGLYFYYDSTEEADDTAAYPSGVVHIMDRDTFYTDEVVDLDKRLDWEKNVEIIPAMADSKWYRFAQGQVESEAAEEYSETYGQEYGAQLVNTNFNFNNDTKDLYADGCYKSGVMVWEKSKYFKKPTEGVPNIVFNGMTYELFRSSGSEVTSTEIAMPIQSSKDWPDLNGLGYAWYDSFPKPQFRDAERGGVDASGVLLFYAGPETCRAEYSITDDVYEMISLNGGEPCWILTAGEFDGAGNRIAYRTRTLPRFTRDLTYNGIKGNIVHSWNFGHPRVTYAPDTFTTEGDSVYDKCWMSYLRDTYDVDTRRLVCNVRAETDGKPWPYWFRRFYWFENSIWRLNEIKDLNVESFDTVRMEFVKVQDMDDFKLEMIRREGRDYLVLDSSSVGCSGGTVTGTVYLQGGGNWAATDFINGTDSDGRSYYIETARVMSPTMGSGSETPFAINFPANSALTDVTWQVSVEDDYDNRLKGYVTQAACEPGPAGYELHVTRPANGERTVSSGANDWNAWWEFRAVNVTDLGAVVTRGSDWVTSTTIEPDQSPYLGSTHILSVEHTENTGAQRTAELQITGNTPDGTASNTVYLVQEAGSQTYQLIWVSPADGTESIGSASTSVTWTLKASGVANLGVSSTGFLTGAAITEGATGEATHTVTAQAPANTGESRTAVITVTGTTTAGTVSLTGSVTQAEAYTLSVYPQGGRETQSGATDTWFGVTLRNINDFGVWTDVSWLTVEKTTEGAGPYTWMVDCDFSVNTGDSRTATIYFSGRTAGGREVTESRYVRQAAAQPVTSLAWIYPSTGNKRVSSGVTEATWLLEAVGVGNVGIGQASPMFNSYVIEPYAVSTYPRATHRVVMYFSENTGDERSGLFTVTASTSLGYLTGNLTQEKGSGPVPAAISLSPSTVSVDAQTGSTTYTISTTGTVTGLTATTDASWISQPITISGNKLIVYYQANPGGKARTATITLSGNGGAVTATATLKQGVPQPDITILSPTAKTVSATVTSVAFIYSVSGAVSDIGVVWTGSWITDITLNYPHINITMDVNDTDTARTASIRVTGRTATGTVSSSCVLEQRGESLRLDPDTLTFGYNSGEVKTTSVYTNNNWRVTDIRDV